MITRRSMIAGVALLSGGLGACRDRLGEELSTFSAGTRGLAATDTHVFVVGGASHGYLWRVPRAGGDAHAIHDRLVEPRDVTVAAGDVLVATDEGLVRQSVHGTQPTSLVGDAVRWVKRGPAGVVWARREGEVGVLGGPTLELGAEIRGLAVGATIWLSTPHELVELAPRCVVAQRVPIAAAGAVTVVGGAMVATPGAIVRADGSHVVETTAAAALVGGDGSLAWVDTKGVGHWTAATGPRWLRGARAQALVLESNAVVWTEAKTRHLRRTPLTSFV